MSSKPTAAASVVAVLLLIGTPALAKVVGGPAEYHDLQPLAAVSYSGPLGLSASAGLLSGTRSACTQTLSGGFVQAEAGLGGGRLSAGVAAALSTFPAIAAIGAKAFVLRSWSSSSTLSEHQTYLGAGVDLTLFHAKVGVAGYQRVSATSARRGA